MEQNEESKNEKINATKNKIENQLARFTLVRLKNQENVGRTKC